MLRKNSIATIITTVVITISLSFSDSTPLPDDVTLIDIRMPGVNPQQESNLCHPMKLNSTVNIVGFEPKAKMPVVHHILLYGCEKPGSDQDVWNCGEMSEPSVGKTQYEPGPVCGSGGKESILYAWAMDAPKLQLPPQVGFQLGPGLPNDINYLVLQVHYKDVKAFLPPLNHTDVSGITLTSSNKEQPKKAGVYLLLNSNGEVGIRGTTHMEVACVMKEDRVIHPFAFRTHAHTHGRVVSGYRIRDNEWTEIGRKDPRLPEMFYNVTNANMTVRKGDILAARCTMHNDDDEPVFIGGTAADEMCNFYVMYYVDGGETLEDMYCATPGPPNYYWRADLDPEVIKNMPDDVSVIPGTNEILVEDAEFTTILELNAPKRSGDLSGPEPPYYPNESSDDNDKDIIPTINSNKIDYERGYIVIGDTRYNWSDILEKFPKLRKDYKDMNDYINDDDEMSKVIYPVSDEFEEKKDFEEFKNGVDE